VAAEKGLGVLLDALPEVRRRIGPTRVLFAGEAAAVIGEGATWRRLRPRIDAEGAGWVFLGVLGADALAALFAASDVTVLPSLNRTESFGLVQVESMLSGTPVVASDLPGVRVPVATTGMGLTSPPGDATALAAALVRVMSERETFVRPRAEVERHFSPAATTAAWERLLEDVAGGRHRGH
jgi:glycosyltransferase involved in cell wall biosynthesis